MSADLLEQADATVALFTNHEGEQVSQQLYSTALHLQPLIARLV
jgi:hypothetical protein